MTSGMPELGSKISLISKADIRYEGRLFTVDPAECTIALANVRSYGTEDRETQFPISPQNQVYDYILFRGSDIKDIRVVNNVPAMPNDPAIMQMQLPPTHMGQQPFQTSQFVPGPMGHMGTQLGPFGGPYTAMPSLGGLTASGLAPGSMAPGVGVMPPKSKQASELNIAIPAPTTTAELKDQVASVLDFIGGGGSRSTTPVSLNSRKSPTADMAVQVNKSGANNSKDGSSNGAPKRNNQNRGQRERRDSNKNDGTQSGGNNSVENKNQQRNQYNNNNQQQQNRGWNNNRGNIRGNRPRGRGPPMQPFRQNLQNNKGRPPKTTIKFEGDYDFEQANSKFEELRLELSKLKVNEEAKPEQVNGEVDKKDDSGNETGAGEHEQEEEEVTVGYDKTKSFFDNISCEAATDRSKGKNRTDWRHERKINSETFGVSSARRGNFYYRGRGGGYFNRNMNMGGYRGGSGGYRSNNFRGRNFNRNYTGGTGIPQQPANPEQMGSATTAPAQPVAVGN